MKPDCYPDMQLRDCDVEKYGMRTPRRWSGTTRQLDNVRNMQEMSLLTRWVELPELTKCLALCAELQLVKAIARSHRLFADAVRRPA